MENENFRKIIRLMEEGIKRLPKPIRDRVSPELEKIKEMMIDNRPPRVLIIGRRGAGKSSLINAIFNERVASVGPVFSETGESQWHYFKSSHGTLEMLDTRGIGDRTKPGSANFEESIDDVKYAVAEKCPDVLLFLCKAKEVDAHIGKDLEYVAQIRQFIVEKHGYEVPVAALATQVDELDPKRVEPPYENDEKQSNIREAVRALQDSFSASRINLLKVIPISTYAEYSNGSKSYDNNWHVGELIEYLMEVLPRSTQLHLARLSRLNVVQKKFARLLVGSTATVCSGLAATPIPVADIIPITTAQIGMISGIGYISGRELSKENAKEFLVALGVNVGTAFVLREAARALVKFVFPGAGNVISASMAFAGTWGIGEAAIAYFIDNASVEESKSCFKRAHDRIADEDSDFEGPLEPEPC